MGLMGFLIMMAAAGCEYDAFSTSENYDEAIDLAALNPEEPKPEPERKPQTAAPQPKPPESATPSKPKPNPGLVKGPEYNAPAGYIEVPSLFIEVGIHSLRLGKCSTDNGQLKQFPNNPYRFSIPKPDHPAWDWLRNASYNDFGGKCLLDDGTWYAVYVRDWREKYSMPVATRGPAYYYFEPTKWK
jgi:hypothetical protein